MKFRKIVLPPLAVVFLGVSGLFVVSLNRLATTNNNAATVSKVVNERCPFGSASLELHSVECFEEVARAAVEDCGQGNVKMASNDGFACKD